MAKESTHYNLDILKGNDIYNPNIVFDNFEKIDTDMHNIDTNAVHSAVHILTGSVNTLTRTNTDYNIFKFVATAPYTVNQTFTVDGQQVSAYTTNGKPLDTNCYVIGATVLCALNGSILTLFVRSSGTAENALKLNNHPDTYFAVRGNTSKTLEQVDTIAVARGELAQSSLNNQKMAVLWENNNTRSEFYPQTINFEPQSYKVFLVIFLSNTSETSSHVIVPMINRITTTVTSIVNSTLVERNINIYDNSATFTRGLEQTSYRSSSENDRVLIPYKIIGILK